MGVPWMAEGQSSPRHKALLVVDKVGLFVWMRGELVRQSRQTKRSNPRSG
ncbi:MAG TPA: hypothetical protein VII44_05880 [Puia sp.]